MQKITLAAAIATALAGVASARPSSTDGNLAAWTFETSVPVNGGPHQAEGGVFAASSTALGATGGTYSNPVGNGSLESFSSNGWDAYSAKAYGFRVLWCNRFGQAPERIPSTPDGEIRDLSALPERLQ